MGADSKIEWCDHTFNPWIGCTKISAACDHCYAKAPRFWAQCPDAETAVLWYRELITAHPYIVAAVRAEARSRDLACWCPPPPPPSTEILVVYWEYSDGPHKGARWWAAHSVGNYGRCADWPARDLRPLGAATVHVTEGVGLDLVAKAAAPR
jgi:hypothetical protein